MLISINLNSFKKLHIKYILQISQKNKIFWFMDNFVRTNFFDVALNKKFLKLII